MKLLVINPKRPAVLRSGKTRPLTQNPELLVINPGPIPVGMIVSFLAVAGVAAYGIFAGKR